MCESCKNSGGCKPAEISDFVKESSLKVASSSFSLFNVFHLCCFVLGFVLISYDAFVVKPKCIESNRVLTEALKKSTESRDRNTAQYKVLDSSLKEAVKFIE